MDTPTELLGPTGPLALALPDFRPRLQQQALAEAVALAIATGSTLLAEAGTGTGKTYAYLVPALRAGKRVIISTGTKNLQDQLYHRDLPTVRQALRTPITTALLKGRANYLCPHRLDLAEQDPYGRTRDHHAALRKIRLWAGRTRDGDISELSGVAEDSPLWPLVTSTNDNCLGQECPRISACFVAKARRAAQEADIVVVNHHLLFADMALADNGFGALLPRAEVFIIDEAHQLPEVATNFFGNTLGSRQLLELTHDTVLEQQQEAGDVPELPKRAERVEKAVLDLRLAFGVTPRRAAWRDMADDAAIQGALTVLHESLAALSEALTPQAARGKGLESCARRAAELLAKLSLFRDAHSTEHVDWFETFTRAFALHRTPLDIASLFQERQRERPGAWIFTSATLTVHGEFNHFTRQLGLENVTAAQWDSPFDYAQRALLYVPEQLPAPNDAGYTRAVIDAALPVLRASNGGAFLLFTSHRALQQAREQLQGQLPNTLLVQGDAPRNRLIEEFRRLGNAILLGTSSFWEGVDVRGPALSLVVIDRLPFASPGDPVTQARLAAIRARGGDPFYDDQLPAAVIALKQGVGRLIRDVSDSGVLMLCDPRIISKAYGQIFLDSLPPMRRTRRLSLVQRFFAYYQTPPEDGVNAAAGYNGATETPPG